MTSSMGGGGCQTTSGRLVVVAMGGGGCQCTLSSSSSSSSVYHQCWPSVPVPVPPVSAIMVVGGCFPDWLGRPSVRLLDPEPNINEWLVVVCFPNLSQCHIINIHWPLVGHQAEKDIINMMLSIRQLIITSTSQSNLASLL